jgi:hypothetical protein
MKVALIAPRSVTYVKGNRNTRLPTNLGTVGGVDGSNSGEMSKSSWMNRKDSKGQIYILLSVEARG